MEFAYKEYFMANQGNPNRLLLTTIDLINMKKHYENRIEQLVQETPQVEQIVEPKAESEKKGKKVKKDELQVQEDK